MSEKYAHLTRQLGILPVEYTETPIAIVGAGAMGSMIAMGLAKCGFSDMTVFDYDKVSVENQSCSMYRPKDIGRPKVEALAEIIKESSMVQIKTIEDKFGGNPARGVVFTAVDSMEARASIWMAHKRSKVTVMFIDPRMSAEAGQIYAIRPSDDEDITVYEKTLHTDAEGVQEACTAKATMYTSYLLPGQCIKTLKSFLTGSEQYDRITLWDIAKSDLLHFPPNVETKKE